MAERIGGRVRAGDREFRDCDRDTERDRDRGPGKRVEGAKPCELTPILEKTDTEES